MNHGLRSHGVSAALLRILLVQRVLRSPPPWFAHYGLIRAYRYLEPCFSHDLITEFDYFELMLNEPPRYVTQCTLFDKAHSTVVVRACRNGVGLVAF